jgi:multiple sugar transport system substrate-binding protein
LDLSKRVAQQKLFLGQSIWAKEGQQAINSGKLAFVYIGSWGQSNIKDWGKSAAGKWRATTLPFNAYGGMGGSTLSILSQSKNKEIAWEFIKFALASEEGQTQNIKDGVQPSWLPAMDLPAYSEPRVVDVEFFGGQKLGELYRALVEKIPPSIGTPLDDDAQKVFGDGINKALDQNQDSKSALAKIADDVERAISAKKTKLLQQIGQ